MQRAFLMNGDEDRHRLSSLNRKDHPPHSSAGSYSILEKIQDKRSNLYGKVLDSSGNVVVSDADSRNG